MLYKKRQRPRPPGLQPTLRCTCPGPHRVLLRNNDIAAAGHTNVLFGILFLDGRVSLESTIWLLIPPAVVRRPGLCIGHLEKEQESNLLRVDHVGQPVVPKNVGEVPRLLTICWVSEVMSLLVPVLEAGLAQRPRQVLGQ